MKLKKLLGDPDFDCPPEMSEVALTIRDLEFKYEDARSLIDGCYELVEIADVNAEWKRKWLESARKHGASSF